MIYVDVGYVADGYIAQTLRPIADIADDGWLPSTGSDLFATVDEYPPSDADYNYSPNNPSTQQAELQFGTATGGTHTAVTSANRLQAVGGDLDFDFDLVQGATILDSWVEAVTESEGAVTREHASTGLTITNPSDLRVRHVARTGETVTVAGFTEADIIDAMDEAFLATPKKSVTFPAGTYDLGTQSGYSTVFDLSGYGDGLSFIAAGAGAEFTIETTGTSSQPIIFSIYGQDNIAFHGTWAFEEQGATSFYPTVTVYDAAKGIVAGAHCTNIHIDNLVATGMLAGFQAQCQEIPNGVGSPVAYGSTDYITIDTITATATAYAFNLQNVGDYSSVGQINTTNCMRSFFVYGCHDVSATVNQTDNCAGWTSPITHYGQRNTSDITLNITDLRDWAAAGFVVDISHINELGSAAVFENITVNIVATFRDPVGGVQGGGYDTFAMVGLHSFDDTPTLLTSSDHTWDEITVTGSRTTHYPWLLRPSFTTLSPTGTLNYPTGEALNSRLSSEFTITYI